MLQGLLNTHFQDIGDISIAIQHLKRFTIKSAPLTNWAGNPNIGEKIHLNLVRTITVTGFAATPLNIEAEPPRLVPTPFRFWQLSIEVADIVKDLDVGRWIRSRSTSNGRLVNCDQLVKVLKSLNPFMLSRITFAIHQIASQRIGENILHERAFARPRHTCHTDKRAERNLHINILQIVVASTNDSKCSAARCLVTISLTFRCRHDRFLKRFPITSQPPLLGNSNALLSA